MEMRSLIRSSLRARPTSLYTTRPSSILQGQFLAPQLSLRFASSNSPPANASRGPNKSDQSSPSNSDASDFDQILDKLNISSAPKQRGPYTSVAADSPAAPSTTPKQRSGGDGYAVARAAGAASMSERHLRKVNLKLGPSLGRREIVEPERGNDLATSLRRLQSSINYNNVKHDSITQKFHIRRGQVRKNVRINRWRKLFKYSFIHTVDRIKRMRAQGW